MARHDLKTWPEFFWPVHGYAKTFELRRDDRAYMPKDVLVLKEWDPRTKKYTGYQLRLEITYVLRADSGIPGLEPGYVILGLGDLPVSKRE